jgi:hypothetical protein
VDSPKLTYYESLRYRSSLSARHSRRWRPLPYDADRRGRRSREEHEAGLELGSERFQGAMAYLIEEEALLGDEHTSIADEGEQHAHGDASYFFTRRALELLEGR